MVAPVYLIADIHFNKLGVMSRNNKLEITVHIVDMQGYCIYIRLFRSVRIQRHCFMIQIFSFIKLLKEKRLAN